MNRWKETVRCKQFLNDDTLSFEEARDGFVSVLKTSRWYRTSEDYSDLREIVEAMAVSSSETEFNEVLDCLYDEADNDRIWIG